MRSLRLEQIKNEDREATTRALLVLVPDTAKAVKSAKRVRRQVRALAERHGVLIPNPKK
jgi:hypothetical protein